jgi:hypothetical protein
MAVENNPFGGGPFGDGPFGPTPVVGGGGGDQTLSPSLYTNSNTFFTHTLTAGVVDLAPSLYTDADTFFTHTLTAGVVDLAPSLYTDADTFFTHTLTAGVVDLAPSLYTDADTFFTHTLLQDGAQQDLVADFFENTNTFYQHAAEVAAVEVPVEVVSGGGGYVRSRKTSFPKHRSDPWVVHRQRLQYIFDEEEYDDETQAIVVKLLRTAYTGTAEFPKSPTNLAALRVLDALSKEDAAGIPVPARLKAVRAEQRVLVRRLVKAYEFVQADEANVAMLLKSAGFTVVQ